VDTSKFIFAALVGVGFAVFAVFLVANADTTDSQEWERWIYVFGAVEAVAFAAVGWVFGREVNRQRAEQAEDRASEAAAKEKEEREKGATLAGLVVGGSGGDSSRFEAMGANAAGLDRAIEYARANYRV
jgi:hypothetical protein